MKRMTMTLVALVAMTICCGAVLAQGAPAPPAAQRPIVIPKMDTTRTAPCIVPTLRMISPQMMQTLALRLNLTEDQTAKITAVLEKSDKALKDKVDAQGKAGEDYVVLLSNPDSTKAQITAAAEKAMKAETAVLMARIDALFEIKALLNAEQNKLLAERLDQYTYPWRSGGKMQPPAPPPPANAPSK